MCASECRTQQENFIALATILSFVVAEHGGAWGSGICMGKRAFARKYSDFTRRLSTKRAMAFIERREVRNLIRPFVKLNGNI